MVAYVQANLVMYKQFLRAIAPLRQFTTRPLLAWNLQAQLTSIGRSEEDRRVRVEDRDSATDPAHVNPLREFRSRPLGHGVITCGSFFGRTEAVVAAVLTCLSCSSIVAAGPVNVATGKP